MNKEVTTGEEAKNKLIEGIEKLSEAVLVTMGPMGRTVIISDEYGNPYITKDGVSVANAIKFKDAIENIAAKLIKQVAQKTADEAGDGTTTSICLAQAFIRHGMELLSNEIPITDLQRGIDELVNKTLKILQQNKRELKLGDIHKVATISANNDEGIGSIIQQAYNHSDIVKVEEGKQSEDEIEIVNGMKYQTSYMSNNFVNDDKKKEVNYDNAKILVLDKKLEDLKPYEQILTYCAKQKLSLIIFTEFVTDTILKMMESNYMNGALDVAIVKAPGFGQYRKDHLNDIANFTGAKLVTHDKGIIVYGDALGEAKKIVIGKLNTVITKADDIDITAKVEDLKDQSKNANISDYDREHIIDRINNLCGSLSIIRVGGSSEVEMKERKDRIDDAVLAVKSALEEGIIEGGGIAFIRAYTDITNDLPSDIIKSLSNVLMAPSYQIFINSNGKINEDTTKNRFDDNIIDPLKVARCALENAASVAKTILSTETVVLNEMQWN